MDGYVQNQPLLLEQEHYAQSSKGLVEVGLEPCEYNGIVKHCLLHLECRLPLNIAKRREEDDDERREEDKREDKRRKKRRKNRRRRREKNMREERRI